MISSDCIYRCPCRYICPQAASQRVSRALHCDILGSVYRGGDRTVVSRLPFDVKINAIGNLALDLKIRLVWCQLEGQLRLSSGKVEASTSLRVVEISIQKLVELLVNYCWPEVMSRRKLTSLVGFAMSLNGTGVAAIVRELMEGRMKSKRSPNSNDAGTVQTKTNRKAGVSI